MCLSLLYFQPCAGGEPDCNCCLSNKYTYMLLRSPEVTRVNFHLSDGIIQKQGKKTQDSSRQGNSVQAVKQLQQRVSEKQVTNILERTQEFNSRKSSQSIKRL